LEERATALFEQATWLRKRASDFRTKFGAESTSRSAPRKASRRKKSSADPPGGATALLLGYIARYPGQTIAEITRRLSPQVRRRGIAAEKLIAAATDDLINREQVVKDSDGRLHVPD
jgi:hypothetical protein